MSASPAEVWDYIRVGDGTAADDFAMTQGCHYDYRAQTWIDGHDHAHYLSDSGQLFFCGMDLFTCQGAEVAR